MHCKCASITLDHSLISSFGHWAFSELYQVSQMILLHVFGNVCCLEQPLSSCNNTSICVVNGATLLLLMFIQSAYIIVFGVVS